MKTQLLLASALAIIWSGALIAGPLLPVEKRMQEQPRRLGETDRKVEAGRILLKWGAYVEKVEGQDRRQWAARLWPSLASADLDNLQKASQAVTYEGMRNALMGQRPYDEEVIDRMAKADAVTTSAASKALGSLASDLVFTPITPCRIVDTRVVGGRIARNATRNLIASNPAGTFLGQGGASTNCGIPANPAALALSVTGLNNTNTGYLRVFPANGSTTQGSPVPLSALNTTVTNDIIVPACQACASDLKVFSTATTHYAAFVTGYYMAPMATAMECLTTTIASIAAPKGTNRMVTAPTCPTGYTRTSTQCQGFYYEDSLVAVGDGVCHFKAGEVSDSYLWGWNTCCRMPGR